MLTNCLAEQRSIVAGSHPARQIKPYQRKSCVVRIRLDAEPEFATHRKHGRILGQNLAAQGFQTFSAGVIDQKLHQGPAEPFPLQVGSDEYRVFGTFVARIRMKPRDTHYLSSLDI